MFMTETALIILFPFFFFGGNSHWRCLGPAKPGWFVQPFTAVEKKKKKKKKEKEKIINS